MFIIPPEGGGGDWAGVGVLPPEGGGGDWAGVGGGLAVWQAIVALPAGHTAKDCLHERVRLPGVAHVRVWAVNKRSFYVAFKQ